MSAAFIQRVTKIRIFLFTKVNFLDKYKYPVKYNKIIEENCSDFNQKIFKFWIKPDFLFEMLKLIFMYNLLPFIYLKYKELNDRMKGYLKK